MIHLITGSLAMAHNIHNIQLNGGNQCIFNVYFAYEMAHFFLLLLFVCVSMDLSAFWLCFIRISIDNNLDFDTQFPLLF